MDAKLLRCGAVCAAILLLSSRQTCADTYTTSNFVVTAPSEEMARKIANCAEFWRRDLAMQWLGSPLPNWYRPCPISVRVGQIGAGGQTTFTFENGEVFGWKMQVQGTLERILDSVIPHEVNHTIFASHFRRPLPRWADEGAATLFEHESERARQTHLVNQVINTSKKIPLRQLLTIKEYPEEMQDVLTLYAEGYALADFLIRSQGEQGRETYLRLLTEANKQGWEQALQHNYGYRSIDELEKKWSGWILAGSPEIEVPKDQSLAKTDAPAVTRQPVAMASAEKEVVRSQSPSDNSNEPARIEPLPSISRQLRTSRPNSEHAAQTPVRTAEVNRTELSLESPYEVRGDSRSRRGEQPNSRSSLPPTTLSPTADGIFMDPNSKSYSFPAARR